MGLLQTKIEIILGNYKIEENMKMILFVLMAIAESNRSSENEKLLEVKNSTGHINWT